MKIVLLVGALLVSACLCAADEDPPLPFDTHMPSMSVLKAQENGVGTDPESGGHSRHGLHQRQSRAGRGSRHHGGRASRHAGARHGERQRGHQASHRSGHGRRRR